MARLASSPAALAPLDEVGWLSAEPESFRRWVAETGVWRTFSPGQFIYLAGEASDGFYGLAEGTIELTFPLVAEEPVGLYLAQKGFWIGDNASLAGHPRLVSMAALSECRMLHLPHRAIMALLKEEPLLAVLLPSHLDQHDDCFEPAGGGPLALGARQGVPPPA